MRVTAILLVALVGIAAGYLGVSALRPAPDAARATSVQPRTTTAKRHRAKRHKTRPRPAATPTPAPAPAAAPVVAKVRPKPKPPAKKPKAQKAPSVAESVGEANRAAGAGQQDGDITMTDPDTGETTTVPAGDEGAG